jgi:hypothetical protein
MNFFGVASNYNYHWRTTSFACRSDDSANECFTAKWEQLLWLPEPGRSARSQD